MKVLIFGASGFIGNPVSHALLRAGHDVYGVTRSEATGKELQKQEITPVDADPLKPDTYAQIMLQMDVIIDCTGGQDIKDVGHTILDTTIKQAAKARPNGPPLSYIYCGGTWVHGDDKTAIISDRSPITKPGELTKWRLEIEQKAISSISKSFTANVVRPALLYGTSASLIGMIFATAKEGKIVFHGDKNSRWATIHQTDLGECFRLVAEKSCAIPGIIFDAANPYPESVSEVLEQLQKVSGAKEIEYKSTENLFQKAVNSSAVLRPTLARSILGWEPRKPPLAQGMQVYYDAWLATQ